MLKSLAPPGLLIGAPRSGSGKTTLTLGLLRALARVGTKVQPFKCGPDYIDTAFHSAAAGRPSYNLDSWSMGPNTLRHIIAAAEGADLAIAEGLMGLFDGVASPGASGDGSSAGLAARFGWPVVLVLDVSGQSQSAAAVALGFAKLRTDIEIAGIVLNRIGSARHERLVRTAMEALGLPVLGALPRMPDMALPERHLGLVQAEETVGLEMRLDKLADFIQAHVDLAALQASASVRRADGSQSTSPRISPLMRGINSIALAKDAAFTFVYPHLLRDWAAAGIEIKLFSPLADEAPPSADICWLPGGYPELHAAQLSKARQFMAGLRNFARTRPVHGECGGYMVLGSGLVDATGTRHAMAGLLELETSFAKRAIHLGYRQARLLADTGFASAKTALRGHEFHYATVLSEGEDERLFEVADANGDVVAETGTRRKNVTGSFFHAIDGELC